MTFVRAIRGDTDPSQMDTAHGVMGDPQYLLESAEEAVEEAERFPAVGYTIVGTWPRTCGCDLVAGPQECWATASLTDSGKTATYLTKTRPALIADQRLTRRAVKDAKA